MVHTCKKTIMTVPDIIIPHWAAKDQTRQLNPQKRTQKQNKHKLAYFSYAYP